MLAPSFQPKEIAATTYCSGIRFHVVVASMLGGGYVFSSSKSLTAFRFLVNEGLQTSNLRRREEQYLLARSLEVTLFDPAMQDILK
jgi:hypothetical protein